MPEVDSYKLIDMQRLNRLEDLVGELYGVLEAPIYKDEPWALNDSFAEGMYLFGEMKSAIRNAEKQLVARYKVNTR
jgi:hypothetical protein